MKTLIQGVRLVDASMDKVGDILFDNHSILAIGENLRGGDCVIDGRGLTLMPAFVDLHAHFRDPGFLHKEDLESGSRAALRGGYTTVNLMGNTKPIVDTKEVYDDIMTRGKELGIIDIEQVMAATKGFDGKTINQNQWPKELKCVSDDGKGILSNRTMFDLLKILQSRDLTVMVHGEDPEISGEDYRVAEDLITIRDVYLSGKTKGRVHFSHVSTIDSLEAIRQGKAKGYPISCEITPHHLSLYDEDYRVNPPIRTKRDVLACREALKDGTCDAIATDHAPHSEEEKAQGAPGMIGLETAFAVCYTHLVREREISLKDLSRLMSASPASILKLNKGRLKTGYAPDLVLLCLEESFEVRGEDFVSRSKNSPYIGKTLYGVVEKTWHRGEIKYEREGR